MLSSISNQAEDDAARNQKVSEAIMGGLVSETPSDEQPAWVRNAGQNAKSSLDEITVKQVDQTIGELKGIIQQIIYSEVSVGDSETNIFSDEDVNEMYKSTEIKTHLIESYTAKNADIIGARLLAKQIEAVLEEYDPFNEKELSGLSKKLVNQTAGLRESDKEVIKTCICVYCLCNGEEVNI